MPTYSGPCQRCGRDIHKYVRPGRKALCLDCGIEAAAQRQAEAADRDSAIYQELLEEGRDCQEQFARGEGEWYERWRGGMERYLKTSFPTKANDPATIRATTPPKGGKSRTRSSKHGRDQR